MTDPPLIAGPHHPLAATPSRRPGSVRRTTTVDVPWPDLESALATIDVRGRDLVTSADGTDRVAEQVGLVLRADLAAGEVQAVDGPDAAAAAPVRGGMLRSGFGRHLAVALPDDAGRRTLLHATLDDLPGAFLVAGYAMLRAGLVGSDPEQAEQSAQRQADVCIGWATGSGMLSFLTRERRTAVPMGPVAPVLDALDPVGWHDIALLPELGMRRRRQLDVRRVEEGGLQLTAHLRDSYGADDHEMVLHEWFLEATVDADGLVTAVTADPRTLPWAECPGAAASAGPVIGMPLADLPGRVRAEVSGPETCTHLSSTLRTLADAAGLARLLDED